MEQTQEGLWTRTCPQCKKIVEHKSKAKCRDGEKNAKVCTSCNRSNVGRSNATTDTCPICNETFNVPVAVYKNKTCELTSHATKHSLTPQQLWMIKHNINEVPKCSCGCGSETKWISWKNGFRRFLIGHNANIYTSYDADKASDISERRKQKLRGKSTWSKGLTKETDKRVALRAEALSIGRKKAFKEGRITIWSKNLTKETDERLAKVSENAKLAFATGRRVAWQKNLSNNTDERLKIKHNKLKQRYINNELVTWHKGKTKEEDPRLNKAWIKRDPVKEYAHVRWSKEEIEKQLESNIHIALESIDGYRNDRRPALNVRCRTCNWIDKVALIFARNDRCPKCQPEGSISQHQIADWIQSLGLDVGRNVRGLIGRNELDIFIPAHNIAIEFNGLYYHNEAAGKNQQYHQLKSDQCTKLGIRLIHVYDDEWHKKRDIVKSILFHALNKTTTKIPARKCSVVFMSPQERLEFFDKNHIDGNTAARVTIGLAFEDRIVAAISLRTPFHKKHKDALEVARVATALNVVVQGGLSKLTIEAKRWAQDNGYARMISYVDTRTGGNGESWKNAGWVEIGQTPPRFWWTDNHSRFNRFKYKANKRLNMTETQIAESAGVVKIWGCKNLVFELAC